MALTNRTLRPGLLVSLRTQVRGNVRYERHVLEPEHATDEGTEKERWETERTVFNPAEHALAVKAQSKARSLISSVCVKSDFGLLCPEEKAADLDKAIDAARAVAEEFNDGAKLSHLSVNVITGHVASDDVKAVKAISEEVRDLLDDMTEGLKNLDVEAVRRAASKAKGIGGMLSGDAAARIQIAVDAARNSAKKIVKAGESVAQEIDNATIRKIVEQRTAFLDLDEVKEIQAPKASARSVDLTPVE
jgi:hypothetical protein